LYEFLIVFTNLPSFSGRIKKYAKLAMPMNRKEKAIAVLHELEKVFPDARTELNYRNEFELLVAVILSAQCTDKRVNSVTPGLFERFPDAHSMASSTPEEIFSYIRSVSYPNAKSRNLHRMAQILSEKYGGNVPSTGEELEELPGVGRKTANVILSVLHNKPTLAVDTHVFRVSSRLGLTQNAKNPLQAEKQLTQLIPDSLIPKAHHLLILHGRYVCLARNPKCPACSIKNYCSFYKKTIPLKRNNLKPSDYGTEKEKNGKKSSQKSKKQKGRK
jgi:endonuclease-3